MLELTKTEMGAGLTELRMLIPKDQADLITDALRNLFLFCGQEMRIKEGKAADKIMVYTNLQVIAGSRLRSLRKLRGMTQADLAEKLDIKRHHISEMENGQWSISPEMAHRLGEALGTSYKAFL
uniref:helix-turn-helix domain-containing protein n=1 Tax=uncultured Bilophila sp. TaxID=529385 RepID=UPI0025F88754|nr:helix-turn-helix transcriptional regulator [uncultured Bilophila sp.]